MKRLLFVLATGVLAMPAFAHEGHGVAASFVWHYFTAPHLLVPMGLVLLMAGLGFILNKYLNQRQ